MSPVTIEVLIYLLWILLGFGAAYMTFSMLTYSIKRLGPNNTNTKQAAGWISAGRMLRMFLIAGLMYGALVWNFKYAIAFIIALTVGTWVLAIMTHVRAKDDPDSLLSLGSVAKVDNAEIEKEEPQADV